LKKDDVPLTGFLSGPQSIKLLDQLQADFNKYANDTTNPAFSSQLLKVLGPGWVFAALRGIGINVNTAWPQAKAPQVSRGMVEQLQAIACKFFASSLAEATSGAVPGPGAQWTAQLSTDVESSAYGNGDGAWPLGEILNSPTAARYSSAVLGSLESTLMSWDNRNGHGAAPVRPAGNAVTDGLDPMVGFLHAAGTNPQFLQKLLMGKLAYFMGTHRWDAAGSDYGTQLGIDVLAAVQSSAGSQGTQLAIKYLTTYSLDVSPTKQNGNWAWDNPVGGPIGSNLAGLRAPTAAMLAYGQDYTNALVNDIVANKNHPYAGGAGLTLPGAQPSVPNWGMAGLMFQVGMSPRGETVLVNALVDDASKSWASRLRCTEAAAYVLVTGNHGADQSAQALDLAAQDQAAQRAAELSLKTAIASDVVSTTGIPFTGTGAAIIDYLGSSSVVSTWPKTAGAEFDGALLSGSVETTLESNFGGAQLQAIKTDFNNGCSLHPLLHAVLTPTSRARRARRGTPSGTCRYRESCGHARQACSGT
jgi:hypothetical protein